MSKSKYSATVFFKSGKVFKYSYVSNVEKLKRYITNRYKDFDHMNVYEKKGGQFIKQIH